MKKRLIAATTFRREEIQLWRQLATMLERSPNAGLIVRQPAYRSLKAKFQRLQAKADRYARLIPACQGDKAVKIKCQKPQ